MSAAASLALLGTAAMAGPQTPPSQPAPSFKAGVELARLDVRVTNADGRPVRDLRQDEPATASRIARGVLAPLSTYTLLLVDGLKPASDALTL